VLLLHIYKFTGTTTVIQQNVTIVPENGETSKRMGDITFIS